VLTVWAANGTNNRRPRRSEKGRLPRKSGFSAELGPLSNWWPAAHVRSASWEG